MRVAIASVPAGRPGRVNEDFAGAVPGALVMVDGAGLPGSEAACRHGTAWYARELGVRLVSRLSSAAGLARSPTSRPSTSPPPSLPEVLAAAIAGVAAAHQDTCRVADPVAPFAAVAVTRTTGTGVEYLVLGDAWIVLDMPYAEPLVVTDPREVRVAGEYGERLRNVPADSARYASLIAELRGLRNRPGGYWVARAEPEAAAEAVTGSVPVGAVRGMAVLSNGAARIAEGPGTADWREVTALLGAPDGGGPAEVVRRVREAERRNGVAPDDATAAYADGLREG